MLTTEEVNKINEWFSDNHPYLEINQIDTETLSEFMSRGYIINLGYTEGFGSQMDCLYDHILVHDLCEINDL
jgi:hypothetical protein